MIAALRIRIARLERARGMGDVQFTLANNAHASIRRKSLLDALHDAVWGLKSFAATILLNATSAGDGSKLHELAQALAAGPAATTEETLQ